MSSAVTSQAHRSSPVTGLSPADPRELLESAGRGDLSAIGQLCDRHGGALFSLARAIVGDADRAESVVVEVIARACADPGATAIDADRSLRSELARLTYQYAARCLAAAGRPVDESASAGLTEPARQQRTAVALVQCGDHTVNDIADLLALPVPVVAALLTSGLRDLQAADSRIANDSFQ